MTMVAVPNVSEGRTPTVIDALKRVMESDSTEVLDVHSDERHNRTVLTAAGPKDDLVTSCVRLAVEAARLIDLRAHRGAHPFLGALDVCPFVADPEPDEAVAAARAAGQEIGAAGIPVYLYGLAAPTDRPTELPDLRSGGLDDLQRRADEGFLPDFGPVGFDPAVGIVSVGARGPLIAFNVNLDCDPAIARRIAARIRTTGGGPPGVRALGLDLGDRTQISMNLTEPPVTGIETAFEAVESLATDEGAEIVSTEIVGLVAQRFLPPADAKATRLLDEPGRSLEAALQR